MSLFRPILYLGLLCLAFIGMLVALAIIGLKDSNNPGAAAPSPAAASPAAASPAPTGVSTAPSNLASPTAAVTAGQSPAAGALEISTPDDIHYDKNELDVSPGQAVAVRYTNNSNIPHNIDFFSGPDASAKPLGLSNIAAGPNNVQTVTFTAPSQPGSYLFHCDVHPDQMNGHLVVK